MPPTDAGEIVISSGGIGTPPDKKYYPSFTLAVSELSREYNVGDEVDMRIKCKITGCYIRNGEKLDYTFEVREFETLKKNEGGEKRL